MEWQKILNTVVTTMTQLEINVTGTVVISYPMTQLFRVCLSKKMKTCVHKKIYKCVYSSFVHNNSNLETTQMFPHPENV